MCGALYLATAANRHELSLLLTFTALLEPKTKQPPICAQNKILPTVYYYDC